MVALLDNDLGEDARLAEAVYALGEHRATVAARDEAGGMGDEPWPPHFAKQAGEPKRVQPSRAKKAGAAKKPAKKAAKKKS